MKLMLSCISESGAIQKRNYTKPGTFRAPSLPLLHFQYSQSWVTKRRQGDDVLTSIITHKRDMCLSFAYGFGMNTIFTGFKKNRFKVFFITTKRLFCIHTFRYFWLNASAILQKKIINPLNLGSEKFLFIYKNTSLLQSFPLEYQHIQQIRKTVLK